MVPDPVTWQDDSLSHSSPLRYLPFRAARDQFDSGAFEELIATLISLNLEPSILADATRRALEYCVEVRSPVAAFSLSALSHSHPSAPTCFFVADYD